MYKFSCELPKERHARKMRNKTAPQISHEYTTSNGIQRVKVLHPTKGWRDRNVLWAARMARAVA